MFALYLLCSSKLHVMRNTTLQCSGRIIVNSCNRHACMHRQWRHDGKSSLDMFVHPFFFFKPIGMASFRELLVWFPLRKDGVMMIQSVLTKLWMSVSVSFILIFLVFFVQVRIRKVAIATLVRQLIILSVLNQISLSFWKYHTFSCRLSVVVIWSIQCQQVCRERKIKSVFLKKGTCEMCPVSSELFQILK